MLGQEQVCEATDTTRATLGASTCSAGFCRSEPAAGRGLADRTRPARLEGHGSEVRRARGSPQVTHPPSHPGGGRTYLHSGADDVHGVGEDGGSGRSQGPRDSLEDDVRALLRTEV